MKDIIYESASIYSYPIWTLSLIFIGLALVLIFIYSKKLILSLKTGKKTRNNRKPAMKLILSLFLLSGSLYFRSFNAELTDEGVQINPFYGINYELPWSMVRTVEWVNDKKEVLVITDDFGNKYKLTIKMANKYKDKFKILVERLIR